MPTPSAPPFERPPRTTPTGPPRSGTTSTTPSCVPSPPTRRRTRTRCCPTRPAGRSPVGRSSGMCRTACRCCRWTMCSRPRSWTPGRPGWSGGSAARWPPGVSSPSSTGWRWPPVTGPDGCSRSSPGGTGSPVRTSATPPTPSSACPPRWPSPSTSSCAAKSCSPRNSSRPPTGSVPSTARSRSPTPAAARPAPCAPRTAPTGSS